MDDFRIGPAPPYAACHDAQRSADSNRKKAKRPKSEAPEEDLILEQSTPSDAETADNLGAEDYYTPSDGTEEPAGEG